MKRIYIIFVLFIGMIFFFACQEKDVDMVSDLERSLLLKSPNNQWIAPDILTLKMEVQDCIEEEHIEICNIDYLSVEKGYAAIIYYITTDGKVGNIIIANVLLKFPENTIIENQLPIMKSTREQGDEYRFSAKCVPILGKTCEGGCSICAVPNGSADEFQCTCPEDCNLIIRIL